MFRVRPPGRLPSSADVLQVADGGAAVSAIAGYGLARGGRAMRAGADQLSRGSARARTVRGGGPVLGHEPDTASYADADLRSARTDACSAAARCWHEGCGRASYGPGHSLPEGDRLRGARP